MKPTLKRLVIATHNLKKGREMITILSKALPELELLTLADFKNAPEPEETGNDYASNAIIKAESAACFTNEVSLADDAGLEIDALEGAPGVFSKRFAGEGTSFIEKMALILEQMKDVPDKERTARFRCCVAIAGPGIDTTVFEATCEGQIAFQPSGGGGFGYDPIFYFYELDCTMADLTAEEKHQVSHRGKVLRVFCEFVRDNFNLLKSSFETSEAAFSQRSPAP